ncbi:MAG: fibronectin type III domain-containing protein [Thermodesulfobacteriota bacterium]|nr:fibronectin type III domain-containing protein [Thermodesulfobacteriota bacterium]
MCRSASFFIVFFIFLTAGMALAKDFKSPHKLEAGQTLSADVLNEIIESLSYSEKIPTRDDFLGTWSCEKAVHVSITLGNRYTPISEQGLFQNIKGTLVFTTDGNGGYYLTETDPEILFILEQDTPEAVKIENLPYATVNNVLSFSLLKLDMDSNYQETIGMANIEFKGDNQFTLYQGKGYYSEDYIFSTVCNKTNIPPEIPEEATTTVSDNSITLLFNDRSEDEIGFVVLRRDKLDSQWNEIASIDPVAGLGNTLSYTDTNLASGTYWYRVQAVNIYGKSLGSNVSKADIP